ncbi:protein containing DUF1239 [Candidatus Magnetomorum sp. HK-1]|nr:protein containing DUF1239 [Candidatus Magnetomorum sp. HK-1]
MWRIHIRILLILVIISVVGGIVFVLTIYRYGVKPENLGISQIESHVDIGLQTVRNVAVKNGKKLWDLQSESVQRISSQSYFSPLTVTFFPNTGNIIELVSKNGCVKDNKNIEIKGHIVIRQPPWQITCDELSYSYTQHGISGKNNVSVKGPGMTMTAKSMHYDLSTHQVTIEEAVALTFTKALMLK